MEVDNSFIFRAPKQDHDAELTIKRSRFIGSVRVVLSVDEANEHIKNFPAFLPKATHYCWAYRIGHGNQLQEHCSDAGEPAGTAGRPILGSIKRNLLENTLVVVTRYFGGVKLGVRGLIDAYEAAAELAISEAGAVTLEVHNKLELACDYDFSKTLATTIKKWGFDEEHYSATYGMNVGFSLDVPMSAKDKIIPEITEWRARGFIEEPVWDDIPLLHPRWYEN